MNAFGPSVLAESTSSVSAGVVCVGCGYDLRGLPGDGHCPECGQEIAQSVRWSRLRWREAPPLSASDPRWVREMSLGPLMVIAAFVLAIGLALWPGGVYVWTAAERLAALSLAFATWTLSCWAAWKLSEPEPRFPRPGGSSRWLLRWGACAYFAAPVLVSIASFLNLGPGWIVPLATCAVGGIFAAGAWVVSAGRLAERADVRQLRLEADLLALFNVLTFLFWLFMPDSHRDGDAVSLLCGSPLLQFGPIDVMREVCGDIVRGRWPHPLFLIALALPLWSVVFSVRLFFCLRRTVARGDGYNPD